MMTASKENRRLSSIRRDHLPVALSHVSLHDLQRIPYLNNFYAIVVAHLFQSELRKNIFRRLSNIFGRWSVFNTCRVLLRHLHAVTKRRNPKLALSRSFLACFSILLATTCIVYPSRDIFTNVLTKIRFIWHTFIAPTGGREHQEQIDNFYKGQADIYDETRKDLLRGRRTMLRLSAAHLLETRKTGQGRRSIWVDIGGGTGYNIEAMDDFLPITSFDAVYLVDICEPLLEISRQRFASHGWTNVHVICQDAAHFVLPEPDWTEESHTEGSITFVTFSYSLSMIPDFYAALDRISRLLSPSGGLLSVVDFYTSGNMSQQQPSVADVDRACGWFSRWFWQIWFDFDHVMLGPQRREYLEHKFSTFKSFNGRNKFLLPVLIRIPYFIWLGQLRGATTYESDCLAPISMARRNPSEYLFHNVPWRMPYVPKTGHDKMNTFMYSFTWEDPFEDMKYLDTSPSDSLLVITSAGDNALHYACEANLQAIHCVDMNPCQGHLLELKMAALKVLPYERFFEMFGLGHLDSFEEILDLNLSPLLSAPCYQFWKASVDMFSRTSPLYMHGYSGYALRLVRALFRVTGRCRDVQQLCSAVSIAEQERIWHERIRPVIVNPLTVLILNHPLFCWRALGVPRAQRRMLLAEGTMYDYIKDTLDPIVTSGLFKDGAYHYLLTLLGSYTSSSCPLYLTRDAFDALKADSGELMDPIRIHTDTISGALRTMPLSSLSRAILMDHMDWFSEESTDAVEEIDLLHRVLKPGGFILLRSAARVPWYIEQFVSGGFDASCLNVRNPGSKVALDRVNMYASFWKIRKGDDEHS